MRRLRWKKWLALVLTIVSAFFGLLAQASDIHWAYAVAYLTCLVVAGIFGFSEFNEQHQEIIDLQYDLDSLESEIKTAHNDLVSPILFMLSDMAQEQDTGIAEQLAEKVRMAVLAAAVKFSGSDQSRIRASLFAIEDDVFVPVASYGRARQATTEIVVASDAGQMILRLARDQMSYFEFDLDEKQPAGWNFSKVRDYKTFISTPVVSNKRCWGFLSVDAPEAGDLLEEDQDFIQLLAGLIGLTYTINSRNSLNQ